MSDEPCWEVVSRGIVRGMGVSVRCSIGMVRLGWTSSMLGGLRMRRMC